MNFSFKKYKKFKFNFNILGFKAINVNFDIKFPHFNEFNLD